MIPTLYGLPALSQDVFNELAQQERLPFAIVRKVDRPDLLSPQDLNFNSPQARALYVIDDAFSDQFRVVYSRLVELKRRLSVVKSLSEGCQVDQFTDVSAYPEDEKKMLRILLTVAKKIELLFMKQMGTDIYIDEIERRKAIDPVSHKLFWRNQTPIAVAPQTQNDPFANALPTFPKPRVDIYPPDVKLDAQFLEMIAKDKEYSDPFSAVAWDDQGKLIKVSYHSYYRTEMEEISKLLSQAAAAIANNSHEKALYTYLGAASDAFLTSNWDAADVKWVALNMGNSKYGIRIAPDEVYWDPANLKAGFEFWLGRVNEKAASFAKTITPLFQDMENHIHELIPQYQARSVPFETPDFLDMMYVAGDHRCDRGAVIGQKLPNGIGKPTKLTVMTNYYLDPKSLDEAKDKAKVIFVEEISRSYQYDPASSSTGTMLHEITHALGPTGSPETLGGQNREIMEELKAQTGALYWMGWLRNKGLIDETQVQKLYLDSIFWCFGHIAQGMVTGEGRPKPYSQLAAIQINHFLKTGAMTLENGLFAINYDVLPHAIGELFKLVLSIQQEGNRALADALRNEIVEGAPGNKAIRAEEIKALYQKYPKPSFNLELIGL